MQSVLVGHDLDFTLRVDLEDRSYFFEMIWEGQWVVGFAFFVVTHSCDNIVKNLEELACLLNGLDDAFDSD